MSDDKKDIRFKKAFMGGFKRQSVADYIEELQKELFESRATAAKVNKDYDEFRLKESLDQQKAMLESAENIKLHKELEDAQAKIDTLLEQAQEIKSATAESAVADTTVLESEIVKERGVSETLRSDIEELKQQLSEEYSANELLASVVTDRDSEIVALKEKIASADYSNVDLSDTDRIKAEAADEIEKVKAEAADEVEKVKAEAADEIEKVKAEAADEIEKVKAEAADEVQKVKAEAADEVEKINAEAERLKAELDETNRTVQKMLNAAQSEAEAVKTSDITEPEYDNETGSESFETVSVESSVDNFETVVETPAEEIIPQEVPAEAVVPQETVETVQEITSKGNDADINEKAIEVVESRTETENDSAKEVTVKTVPSEDAKTTASGAPTIYDKAKIADIISKYSNIRNQTEDK